jgi:chromosome segregation ATPase
MQAVLIAISYIFIIILSFFIVRSVMDCSRFQTSLDDLKATQLAHSRRLEQLATAISTLQAAILQISAGASEILTSSQIQQTQQQQQDAIRAAVSASMGGKNKPSNSAAATATDAVADGSGSGSSTEAIVASAVQDVIKGVMNFMGSSANATTTTPTTKPKTPAVASDTSITTPPTDSADNNIEEFGQQQQQQQNHVPAARRQTSSAKAKLHHLKNKLSSLSQK